MRLDTLFGKTMKTLKLLTLFCALVMLASSPLFAAMEEEDTIGIADWKQWNQKEKLIFITGFRLGTGLFVHTAPATTDKELILRKGDFEDMIKRVNLFYADTANKDVTIRGAIEVTLMQMREVDADSVAKKLKSERTRKMWGF